MMQQLFWVAVGGASGSVLRFLCQRTFNNFIFPYGTLLVNIAGCFLIGLLWAAFDKTSATSPFRLLLMTGFCGGFTSFSAFTQESINLLMQQRWVSFLLYVVVSITAGLLATFTGYKLMQ